MTERLKRKGEGAEKAGLKNIHLKKIIFNDQNSSHKTLGLLLGFVLGADKAPAAEHVAS